MMARVATSAGNGSGVPGAKHHGGLLVRVDRLVPMQPALA
jgi:hypothetical protein